MIDYTVTLNGLNSQWFLFDHPDEYKAEYVIFIGGFNILFKEILEINVKNKLNLQLK